MLSPMPTTKPSASFTYTDQEELDLWREALAVISIKGKSYRIGDREYQHHNLKEVRETVEYWKGQVNANSSRAVLFTSFEDFR